MNILHCHPLIRLKVYLCLHILLFTSRTYYVLTQTYSPWKPTGVNVLHPDTSIIQRSTSVFPFCRAPCGPPCSHQYSSLKGVRVNTLHSLSFDFTHRLPLLSCLVVHPCKPQEWISFILVPSFSAQSRLFEGITSHFTSFPDCCPHLPHKENNFSLKITGLNFISDYLHGTHQDFLGLFNSSFFEKLNPYYHRHQSPFHRGINWPSHLLHKATYFSLKNNRVKFHSWIPTRYSSRLSWLIQFITLSKVKTLLLSPSVPLSQGH